MAENDIVRGLFGPTPYEVEQQQREKAYADSRAYGMMTHQARNIANERNTGYEIGQTLGKMVGYVDPERQKAEQKQAILSRYDLTKTDGLAQAIQAAKAMGRNDVALDLQQYHASIQKQTDAHEKTQSEILQNSARAEKMRRLGELKNNYPKEYNMALNEAKRLHPNDPEAEQAAMEGLINRFVRDPNTKLVQGFDANGQPTLLSANSITGGSNQVGGSSNKVQEHFVGVEGKPNLKQLQVLDTKTGLWVNQGSPIEAHGEGVKVNVDHGEKAFDVETGKLDAKALAAARTSADAARLQKRSIKEMSNMNDNDLISGSFASSRVGLLNIFDTLGFSTMDESSKLASSQIFQKASGDLILSKIGALGYNPSNADLAFIQKILPQLESSPAARRELIHFMDVAADSVIENFTKMDAYARAHKSLGGYVPVQNTYTPLGNAPKITRQEAIEELARRNKK